MDFFVGGFLPELKLYLSKIEKLVSKNAQLDKRNILLSRLLILDKCNLSSGKNEL